MSLVSLRQSLTVLALKCSPQMTQVRRIVCENDVGREREASKY
jgi:hypothetical protein